MDFLVCRIQGQQLTNNDDIYREKKQKSAFHLMTRSVIELLSESFDVYCGDDHIAMMSLKIIIKVDSEKNEPNPINLLQLIGFFFFEKVVSS